MASGGVHVPRGVLVALSLGTLLAAFLLGRQFSRVDAPSSPTPSLAPPPEFPSPGPPSATTDGTPVPPFAPLTAAPFAAGVPPADAVAAPVAAPADGDQVARYFQESEAIQARAKYWSDPQALAKTILEQAAGGDANAFDELIRAQAGAKTELERLSVPAACAEHHRRSVAVMGEALGLLERVRGALSSGDLGGLDGVQETASALEREARAIDELGRSIRQR